MGKHSHINSAALVPMLLHRWARVHCGFPAYAVCTTIFCTSFLAVRVNMIRHGVQLVSSEDLGGL